EQALTRARAPLGPLVAIQRRIELAQDGVEQRRAAQRLHENRLHILQLLPDILLTAYHGEKDRRRLRRSWSAPDEARGFQPIELRHIAIDDDQIERLAAFRRCLDSPDRF